MALNLSQRFSFVVGLDPSAKMVEVGLQPEKGGIEYAVASAETLPLEDNSVDLVVAGQAAHWFDHAKTWKEIGRVLRPRGTVAYVVSFQLIVWPDNKGYGEMVFPSHPGVNKIVSAYQGGQDALGPHWSQPGRSIVEGLLDAVPFPVTPAPDARLLEDLPSIYDGGHPVASSIDEPIALDGKGWDASTAVRIKSDSLGRQWFLRPANTWNWDNLEGYLRSASALHVYHEAHPEDKAKRGKEGDIVQRLLHDLKSGLAEEGERGDTVDVAWPLVLMMISKA